MAQKSSITPYDDLRFAILERIKEPDLEHGRRLLTQLCNELLNADPEGPHPQDRNTSEQEPSKTKRDDSITTAIVPGMAFDEEQF
ncbi:hypothetical protein ACTXT7_003520 [Hymenolepis weldensis]